MSGVSRPSFWDMVCSLGSDIIVSGRDLNDLDAPGSLNPDWIFMAECTEGCAGSGECEMACAESHEDGFWDFVAYFGDAGCMGNCGLECL